MSIFNKNAFNYILCCNKDKKKMRLYGMKYDTNDEKFNIPLS